MSPSRETMDFKRKSTVFEDHQQKEQFSVNRLILSAISQLDLPLDRNVQRIRTDRGEGRQQRFRINPPPELEERKEWMEKLRNLREEDGFTDALIETSDQKVVRVDRNVLSASSPYFKALFLNSLDPMNKNRVLALPDVDSALLKMVVDFCYTGQMLGINAGNCEALIKTLDMLDVRGALNDVHDYLINSLSNSTCIHTYKLGRTYYAPKVIEKAKLFILHNLCKLKEATALLGLNHEEFKEIISDDRLNVRREETTFEAIVRWIESDAEARTPYFGNLLKQVRFGNAALNFIDAVVKKHPMVRTQPDLMRYLGDVNAVLSDIQADPQPSKFDVQAYPFLRPRIPRDVVFVFGGWSHQSATFVIETYDCRVNKWYSAEGFEGSSPRAYHGMVYVQGLVYIIGGFDGRQHFNTVCAFDPRTKLWHNKACMRHPRCYVSVAVVDDIIFALGGFDGMLRTDTCEMYDYKTNQWSLVAPMNHQRSDASAAVIDGKIYIVGGFNGIDVLPSAEYYDPSTNVWTLIESMVRPRSGVQLVAFSTSLFAIGGNDGVTRQTSVEKYDTLTNEWVILGDMSIPRSNFAAVSLEGYIYVIGGFNGTSTIPEVECYDPQENTWTSMWGMNVQRSALSACIVDGLENAKAYTWLRRELNASSSGSIATPASMASST